VYPAVSGDIQELYGVTTTILGQSRGKFKQDDFSSLNPVETMRLRNDKDVIIKLYVFVAKNEGNYSWVCIR